MPETPSTILLVDDDVDFLEINRRILEAVGYRVVCAHNPSEAMPCVDRESPDLVITDLMMGNLDSGFSFARQLKHDSRYAGIPVIIATGASSQAGFDFRPRTAADLAAMNADAFLEKPTQPKALLDCVARLLERESPQPSGEDA